MQLVCASLRRSNVSNTKKLIWQREARRAFASQRGCSMTADYATGGLRGSVLERDRRACVKCGLTDLQHLTKWNRPITVDHKNKDRSVNTMENLQTLCLSCHGRKDLIEALRVERVSLHREEIMKARAAGKSYNAIAKQFGFSIAAVWKWTKRWEAEKTK